LPDNIYTVPPNLYVPDLGREMDAFVKRRPLSDSRGRLAKRIKASCSGEEAVADSEETQGDSDDDERTQRLLRSADSPAPGLDSADSRPSLAPDIDDGKTPFESSLPPIETDQDAVDAYEAASSSQGNRTGNDDSPQARLEGRNWVRGRSSIYVDAFNLVLEIVLEDEAHLFDDQERAIFEAWKALSYEAQYLLVCRQSAVEELVVTDCRTCCPDMSASSCAKRPLGTARVV
jgi:Fanconi-associated nuclease 1